MTPLTRESVERMMALCEKAARIPPSVPFHDYLQALGELRLACDPQTIRELCRHYLDTAARGQGEDSK